MIVLVLFTYTSLRSTIRIERTCATQELDKHKGQEIRRTEAALEILCHGDGRIDMCAAHRSNQNNGNRQCSTDDEGIAATHQDNENEKEGAEVLGEIGGGAHRLYVSIKVK